MNRSEHWFYLHWCIFSFLIRIYEGVQAHNSTAKNIWKILVQICTWGTLQKVQNVCINNSSLHLLCFSEIEFLIKVCCALILMHYIITIFDVVTREKVFSKSLRFLPVWKSLTFPIKHWRLSKMGKLFSTFFLRKILLPTSN